MYPHIIFGDNGNWLNAPKTGILQFDRQFSNLYENLTENDFGYTDFEKLFAESSRCYKILERPVRTPVSPLNQEQISEAFEILEKALKKII